MRCLALALSLSVLSSAFAQRSDQMWFAGRQGRTLVKINACGEVMATVDLAANGFDLARVAQAPNGNLWLINFIRSTFTILDANGVIISNISTASFGSPYDVTFDRSGTAWMTITAGMVVRFDPTGTQVGGTITVPPNPLSISIDRSGNAWVAHRQTAPSQVSKIDGTTFAVTSYPLPAGSRTLGGVIYADNPGTSPTATSLIWTSGDSANEVHVLDSTGTVVNSFNFGANANAGISGLAQDGQGNMLALGFRTSASQGEVYRFDRTGTLLQTVSDSPEPIAVFSDSFGRGWYLNRITFSGPTPTEARRLEATPTGTFETIAPVGVGSYQIIDPGGFQRATVVDPFGDSDGDGAPNLLEAINSLSPYDRQSNPNVSIITRGRTDIGQTPVFEISGTTGSPCATFLATAGGPPISVPGINGQLRLAPASILGIVLNTTIPTSLPIAIPADPALRGFALKMQTLSMQVNGPTLSNDTCIAVD